MDLAAGAKEVRVLWSTPARTAARASASLHLPLTARRASRRIYTNLAVLEVTGAGIVVREMIDGLDLDGLRSTSPSRSWCWRAIGSGWLRRRFSDR